MLQVKALEEADWLRQENEKLAKEVNSCRVTGLQTLKNWYI
jgi:hypothetical protein